MTWPPYRRFTVVPMRDDPQHAALLDEGGLMAILQTRAEAQRLAVALNRVWARQDSGLQLVTRDFARSRAVED